MNITLVDVSKETAEAIVEALRDAIAEGSEVITQLSNFPKVQEMMRARNIDIANAMDQIMRQTQAWGAPAQHFDMREADTRDSHGWETLR